MLGGVLIDDGLLRIDYWGGKGERKYSGVRIQKSGAR